MQDSEVIKMDPEKEGWLKSIGAIIQPWEHCKYYVPATKMHYSVEYIEKTSLAELKARHEKNLKFMSED